MKNIFHKKKNLNNIYSGEDLKQGDLLEIIQATHTAGRFASLLHGGQQEGNQNGNDGDDDQKFDEGEA